MTVAINQYLAKHGEACTLLGTSFLSMSRNPNNVTLLELAQNWLRWNRQAWRYTNNPLVQNIGQSSSMSASAIWHSLRELVSSPEVWLAQCLCESNQSLPYRKLVESAKAEKQRIRIGTSQSASIDGENLNTLGRRQLFGSP